MRRTIEEVRDTEHKRPVKKTAKRVDFSSSRDGASPSHVIAMPIIDNWGIFPKDVWQLIISMLSPYEQRLSRYWSRLFKSLKLNPVTDELRKIVRELSYDIPPESLTFESLYFRSDKKLTLIEKENFVRKLENIWSHFHHNSSLQDGFYEEHNHRLLLL